MYSESSSSALRFGDIVGGFVAANLIVSLLKGGSASSDFRIAINHSQLMAVLSPCCSIEDKTLLLAPLQQLTPRIYENPYFAEDVTRINRRMQTKQSLPPIAWESMDPATRDRKLAEPDGFTLLDMFVYRDHELLPPYKVKTKQQGELTVSACSIDFRKIVSITCDQVQRNSADLLATKRLELTTDSRSELREKIAHFYARVPEEDR